MPYSVDDIAAATGCPQRNVAESWPAILKALDDVGIRADKVEIAAAATVAVETGSFRPIIERHADPKKQPDIWLLQERYWASGFMGRGYIQLTWKDNYDKYGKLIGVDLLSNPDAVLIPEHSAAILALYFKERHVNDAAEAKDWKRVRRLVNGGMVGFDKFSSVVKALGGYA